MFSTVSFLATNHMYTSLTTFKRVPSRPWICSGRIYYDRARQPSFHLDFTDHPTLDDDDFKKRLQVTPKLLVIKRSRACPLKIGRSLEPCSFSFHLHICSSSVTPSLYVSNPSVGAVGGTELIGGSRQAAVFTSE